MDQPAPERQARQQLAKLILDLGSTAYNPDAPGGLEAQAQAQAQKDFSGLIERRVGLFAVSLSALTAISERGPSRS
jgi:hypothetical protein